MTTPEHTSLERLKVEIYPDRRALGEAAGKAIAHELRARLRSQDRVRMIFAAAPSQLESLVTLVSEPAIDWSRVTAFHMDEYIGLPPDAPQRFSHFLDVHLFRRVKPGRVHRILPQQDPQSTCEEYGALLAEHPIDMVCLGIGENGHLAFNDPPVADFADPKRVKIVTLDDVCRQQQVNDGCFPALEDVPTRAVTLTVPSLFSAQSLFCMVPGKSKSRAIQALRAEPVSTAWPATVLRRHPQCTLFTDRDAWGA